MLELPQPDRSGNIDFGKRKEGAGKTIEDYPPAQTIGNLNKKIDMKFIEERDKAKGGGKSEIEAENVARSTATRLPEFNAVQKWLDIDVEIKQ